MVLTLHSGNRWSCVCIYLLCFVSSLCAQSVDEYLKLGETYRRQGRYNLADTTLNKALEIFIGQLKDRKAGKEELLKGASVEMELGKLYMFKQEWKKASFYLDRSAVLRAEILGAEHPDYAEAVTFQSLTALKLRNAREAQHLIKLAENAFTLPKNQETLAYAFYLEALHVFALFQNNYSKAEEYIQQAAEVIQRRIGRENQEYTKARHVLMMLHIHTADFEKALQLYWEIKPAMDKHYNKKHPEQALFLCQYAKLQRVNGAEKEAEKSLLAAMEIAKKTVHKNHSYYRNALFDLISLYNASNSDEEAEVYRKEERKERNVSNETASYNQKVIALRNRALVLAEQGKHKAATVLYKQAFNLLQKQMNHNFLNLTEKERESFWQHHYSLLNHALSLAFQSKEISPALAKHVFDCALFSKGLLFNSSQAAFRTIEASNDSMLIEDLRDFRQAKNDRIEILEALNQLEQNIIKYNYTSASKPYKVWKQNKREFQIASDELETFEKLLILLSQEPIPQVQPASPKWKDIKKILTRQELAIEFVAFTNPNVQKNTATPYRYAALLIGPDFPQPVVVYLCNNNELGQALNQYGPTSPEVYNIVCRPLEKYLEGKQHIYIAPAGLLSLISFAGLKQADGYLGDKHIFHNLLYTEDLVTLKSKEPFLGTNLQAALLGGADYQLSAKLLENLNPERGTGFSYLPGSLEEVQTIQQLLSAQKWNTQIYTDRRATKRAFTALSSTHSPELIHVSTHGFYLPHYETSSTIPNDMNFYQSANHPLLRSGLLFTGANRTWNLFEKGPTANNGILTALDISTMNLSNTRLVVLSACHTGWGDIQSNEGVFGLQRAFRLAGVQSMIVSLWAVNDQETMELMQEFYTQWSSGKELKQAFTDAQNAQKRRYPDAPEKWAGFILIE